LRFEKEDSEQFPPSSKREKMCPFQSGRISLMEWKEPRRPHRYGGIPKLLRGDGEAESKNTDSEPFPLSPDQNAVHFARAGISLGKVRIPGNVNSRSDLM
jgi:hypothetical protein